jgi:hypothetical protein
MNAYTLPRKTIPRILVSHEEFRIDTIRGHKKVVGDSDFHSGWSLQGGPLGRRGMSVH